MKYTLPTANLARTTDYVGTTDDYVNDPDVAALKESVARHNDWVRSSSRKHGRVIGNLLRVRVKPRGPRRRSYYHTLVKDATHFDIYQGEDSANQYDLRREIDSGLTPGELKALDKLRSKIWRMELEGKMRKRRNG